MERDSAIEPCEETEFQGRVASAQWQRFHEGLPGQSVTIVHGGERLVFTKDADRTAGIVFVSADPSRVVRHDRYCAVLTDTGRILWHRGLCKYGHPIDGVNGACTRCRCVFAGNACDDVCGCAM